MNETKPLETAGITLRLTRAIMTAACVLLVFPHVARAQDAASPGPDIFGFFDVNASTLAEAENPYGLGPFELDLESSFNDRISGSAAMVFEDGVAEIGVGFVDLHFYDEGRASSSPRGRIFTDPGYHLQAGQFDIPFGVDYLFYATPDRISISPPLLTDILLDGGWTDRGMRFFRADPVYNVTGYMVNGFDEGYAFGGRFGVRPFENPFSSHDIREVPVLELGISGVGDVDRVSAREYILYGVDSELNTGPFQFIAEYARKNHEPSDSEQSAFYVQGTWMPETLISTLFLRYDDVRESAPGADELATSRLTVAVGRELFGVTIIRFEAQRYLDTGNMLSEHEDVVQGQLVISF